MAIESKNILPKPSIDYFPKVARDNTDAGWIALSNKIDELCRRWELSTLSMEDFRDPVKIRPDLIIELGILLSAGIDLGDDERTRREKVSNAIDEHKKRGSFTLQAKPVIDAITGFSSSLFNDSEQFGDWIHFDDTIHDTAFKWGVWDAGITGDDFGQVLFVDGTENQLAGVVYIDLGDAGIPAGTIDDVVEALENDIAPAYFVIFLGSVTGGIFTKYPNGEIS